MFTAPIQPAFYERFVDDGFGVWTGTETELKEFAAFASIIHKNIKVELRYHKRKIEFLDTLVKIENGHIYTDLYIKPTDKQLYLNSLSNHPSNTKKGLAYGLGLRIRKICEKDENYNRHRRNLKVLLRKRGYSGKLIETQLQKVDRLEGSELLNQKRREKNNKRVPLVMTYTNLLPNVHSIVRKHVKVLYRSDRLKGIFRDPPIVAFKRDMNLSDTLINGKTNKAVKVAQISCKPYFKFCKLLYREEVQDTKDQTAYNPVTDVTCRIRNIIYGIICKVCQSVVYVGETERELQARMTEHLRDIKLKREKPINHHFG